MRVKSDEKRQAILDIAKESFTKQGFEQTSMSHISKQLGGSKATLYNYFCSKEEIFSAVMEQCAASQISNSFLALEQNSDIRSALLEFGYNFLKSVLRPEVMAIYRMAIHDAERSDIGKHFYENGPKRGWTRMKNYLSLQTERGVLLPCDPWVAAMQFKALLYSEYHEPYALGAIEQPSSEQLRLSTERAVTAFLCLYQKAA